MLHNEEHRFRPGPANPRAAGGGRLTDHGAHRCTRDQRPRAIAIREHGAAPRPRTIQPPRGRDLKSLHATRERDAIRGLDHELKPARHDGEMNDPEVGAPEAAAQRALDRTTRV